MNHLKLVIKDKKKWDISLESMLDLKEMVTMIHEQFPNAIFGTSDELKKKAKTDFDSLISIVENRAEYNY